jgi:hypothetical protein
MNFLLLTYQNHGNRMFCMIRYLKKIKRRTFWSDCKNFTQTIEEGFDRYLSDLDRDMKIMTVVHLVAANLGMEKVVETIFFKYPN